MSVPSLRPSGTLTPQVPQMFTRSEGKQLARLQNAELIHGLVAATRVQAAAMVVGIGLNAVGMLSREAQFQSGGDPVVVNRANHIVDQFACLVGNEVAWFGR